MEQDPFWHVESIPDNDFLFRRVHKHHVKKNGDIAISIVFEKDKESISTDWSNYSTPQETKDRVKCFPIPKDPQNYGVINMKVLKVRNIEGQSVEHSPLNENRAHTDIKGKKSVKEIVQFSRIYDWSIHLTKL